MTDPQSNGHAPMPVQPQPAGHHALQAMGTRVQEQRQIISTLEDQLDYQRAMRATVDEQLHGLAAENSRMMAQLDQLKARLRDAGIDPDEPVAEGEPQDAASS